MSSELTDEVHGAWATGKAPLSIITDFMTLVQQGNTTEAIPLAEKILTYEPNNATIKEFVSALTDLQQVQENEESSSEDESEDSSSENSNNDDDDDDDDDDCIADSKTPPYHRGESEKKQ